VDACAALASFVVVPELLNTLGAGEPSSVGASVGTGDGCRVAATAVIELVSTEAPGIDEATDAVKALEVKSASRALAKSEEVLALTVDRDASTVKLTDQS
jgi:hypothetical protein